MTVIRLHAFRDFILRIVKYRNIKPAWVVCRSYPLKTNRAHFLLEENVAMTASNRKIEVFHRVESIVMLWRHSMWYSDTATPCFSNLCNALKSVDSFMFHPLYVWEETEWQLEGGCVDPNLCPSHESKPNSLSCSSLPIKETDWDVPTQKVSRHTADTY